MASTNAVRRMRQRAMDKKTIDAVFVDPYNRTVEPARLAIIFRDPHFEIVGGENLGQFEVEAMTGKTAKMMLKVVGHAGPKTAAGDRWWYALSAIPQDGLVVRHTPGFKMRTYEYDYYNDFATIRGRAYVIPYFEPTRGLPAFPVDASLEAVRDAMVWVDPIKEPDYEWQRVMPAACVVCDARGGHRCSVCKFARYCGPECQRQDWKRHRAVCSPMLDIW